MSEEMKTARAKIKFSPKENEEYLKVFNDAKLAAEEMKKILFGMRNCKECEENNKLFGILHILQWRGDGNYLSGLLYDDNTEQILVNKDALMRAIQMANPIQPYRDIRLVSHDEFMALDRSAREYPQGKKTE